MSITAMKMALEALEKSEPNKRKGDDDYREIGWMEQREAIAAIKQALVAPVQEPVAWAVVGDGKHGKYAIGRTFETGEKPNFKYWETRGYEPIPLYTTPQPQGEWVNLTDKEIQEVLIDDTFGGAALVSMMREEVMVGDVRQALKRITRTIETKLKEKNGF